MKTKQWGLFWLVGLIWGTSFFWIKIALEEVSPVVLVAFRSLFGSIGLGLIILIKKKVGVTWAAIKDKLPVFLILGLINIALPWSLISWAEQFIDSGTAAILNGSMPLFTVFLSPIFLKEERISLPKMAGLVIGFLGVVLLMAPSIQNKWSSNLIGQFASLLASLFYAVSTIFARKKTGGIPADIQAFLQLSSGTLIIWVYALFTEHPFTLPQTSLTWLSLVWLGVLGSSFAYIIYFYLLHKIGTTRTSMITYIPPLVGMILGVGFLKEQFYWQALVGALMILSGIAIVNMKKKVAQTA